MPQRRWIVAPPAPSTFLARFSHLPPLVAQILFNRGITSVDEVKRFVGQESEQMESLGASPFEMLGIPQAVERLRQATRDGEMIAVYGDFDADGVCATALLTQVLKSLGAKVIPYIPHRIHEGYGLNSEALKELKDKGVRVVVTVDCGIRSLAEVEVGSALGLDMIITDHHSVGIEPPRALAVINPKQPGDPYPFKELAGVGIAFKLAQALLMTQADAPLAGARPVELEQLLDLVALGTVADLVPLIGENRVLAKRGIQHLNVTERPGLQALLRQTSMRGRKVDAGAIAFFLGPRLNAAGRIDHARTAYQLLMTQYPGEAEDLAARLEATNRERQKLTDEMVTKAREMIAATPNEWILLAASPEFPEGIIGLIASKLAEETYRPAIALSINDKYMRGSARSIPEFNIVAALDECAALLVRHGGHAAAAGFTVNHDKFDHLRHQLQRIAARELALLDLTPTITIDAEARLGDMNWKLLEYLERLAPFGYGNREPVFLVRNVIVRGARIVGTEHLALTLTDGVAVWDAIAFRQKDLYSQLLPLPAQVDAVFTLTSKVWQGEPRLQLEIKDLRMASG